MYSECACINEDVLVSLAFGHVYHSRRHDSITDHTQSKILGCPLHWCCYCFTRSWLHDCRRYSHRKIQLRYNTSAFHSIVSWNRVYFTTCMGLHFFLSCAWGIPGRPGSQGRRCKSCECGQTWQQENIPGIPLNWKDLLNNNHIIMKAQQQQKSILF